MEIMLTKDAFRRFTREAVHNYFFDPKAYAEYLIALRDLTKLAFGAVFLRMRSGMRSKVSEDARRAFERVCRFVHEESDFTDEERLAFQRVLDENN